MTGLLRLQVAGVMYYFPFQSGSETLPVEDNPLLADASEEGPTQSEMGPVTQDPTQAAADGMTQPCLPHCCIVYCSVELHAALCMT